MKIGIIGKGKLGSAIAKCATAMGDEIVFALDSKSMVDATTDTLKKAEVLIESTHPDAAIDNLQLCAASGVPTVCGTTGWLQHKASIDALFLEQNSAFLYASNFSVGMNLVFKINEVLASFMASQENYSASIEEIHHIHKKDAPSGTAIQLAKGIFSNHNHYELWSLEDKEAPGMLHIKAIREGEAKGTHIVQYESAEDVIRLSHDAFNRNGFAKGAHMAAHWIVGKKGIFSMKDVLSLH